MPRRHENPLLSTGNTVPADRGTAQIPGPRPSSCSPSARPARRRAARGTSWTGWTQRGSARLRRGPSRRPGPDCRRPPAHRGHPASVRYALTGSARALREPPGSQTPTPGTSRSKAVAEAKAIAITELVAQGRHRHGRRAADDPARRRRPQRGLPPGPQAMGDSDPHPEPLIRYAGTRRPLESARKLLGPAFGDEGNLLETGQAWYIRKGAAVFVRAARLRPSPLTLPAARRSAPPPRRR